MVAAVVVREHKQTELFPFRKPYAAQPDLQPELPCYSLLIDMEDFAGETKFASYGHFSVESEEHGFRLYIADYSGTAGRVLVYSQSPK